MILSIKKLFYGLAVVKTRVLWGPRLAGLGRRVTLGRRALPSRLKSVSIGDHTMISDRWILMDLAPGQGPPIKIEIGSWCRIQHDFQANARVGISIGDFCLIAPRVFITDSDHVVPADQGPTSLCRDFNSAPVVIEESCWLGVNAVVLKGVKIGHHSIVGANSVVTKSFPPRSIIAGSPARVIGQTSGSAAPGPA